MEKTEEKDKRHIENRVVLRQLLIFSVSPCLCGESVYFAISNGATPCQLPLGS